MSGEEHPIAKFIRLQNGDDIIAETVEYEDEKGIMYMVINPLKVYYTQSPDQGYLSVSFMPWVFPRMVTYQEFMVHADDILLISDVSEKMNTYYWDNQEVFNNIHETAHEVEHMQEQEETIANILEELASSKRTYH